MAPELDLSAVQAVICDVDGTLWRGARPLPGAHTFLQFLQRQAIPFVLAANNATRPSDHYRRRLAAAGIEVTTEQIVTGAQRAGLKTILVETGVDDAHAVAEKGIEPDAVFVDLSALTDQWQLARDGPVDVGAGVQI